jgi:hypothetical protein
MPTDVAVVRTAQADAARRAERRVRALNWRRLLALGLNTAVWIAIIALANAFHHGR